MVIIVVPIIPNNITTISMQESLSLINTHASIAANIGPVVKLMVLDRVNGINAIAAY